MNQIFYRGPNPLHPETYDALLRAGPRARPLRQVHARIVVAGLHRTRSLLTKLLILTLSSAFASPAAHSYAHRLLLSIPDPDPFLFNSIITSAAKSRRSRDSILFYRRMSLARLEPSNYTFTSVIKACADLSDSRIGRVVHARAIVNKFDLDMYVQTALSVFYSKSGDLVTARKLFDRMPERTVVAWNAMIAGYEQNGLAEEAVDVFRKMQEAGKKPDSATLVSLLSACSQLGALNLGQWVNDYIVDECLEVDMILATSLINMYSRCGHVSKAREIFDGLQERNVIAWTAMISGYGVHGYGCEAFEIFQRMRLSGPKPNKITFTAVLSACAHAGLVSEGREAFASMKRDYALIPQAEHQVCMVDMLGRAGLLDEAMQFIREDIAGNPGAEVWTAMLGACKMHKNSNLAVEVAEKLLTIEPDDPAHYVLLSNIYALAGRMNRVEKIRNVMIRRGLKKQTGYSSIEINQAIHVFCMGDTSHPQAVAIYQYLEELIHKIRNLGYVPVTDSILHDLEEEEREFALRIHSEKLAVAFGLMNTSDNVVIRIVKNLRMCDDCHLAIKCMSFALSREIIVRDKLRFHHFNAGFCSCHDYW